MLNKKTLFIALLINKTTLHTGDYSTYIALRFGIDIEHETYERSVSSFWEFIGLIGGIYEILDVSFAVFVCSYNSRMFTLNFIDKKIKVLNKQTHDDFEKLKFTSIKTVREEQKQLNNRLSPQILDGINARKRSTKMQHIKQFDCTDCIKDLV